MSDKHLEVSEKTHKELKELSEKNKIPIKYLTEEFIKAGIENNKKQDK